MRVFIPAHDTTHPIPTLNPNPNSPHRSHHLSGADLAAVMREAGTAALRRMIERETGSIAQRLQVGCDVTGMFFSLESLEFFLALL